MLMIRRLSYAVTMATFFLFTQHSISALAQDGAEDGGASGSVLVASPAAVVTSDDFSRYISYRFPDGVPPSALAREGAVRAAIESIYTIRIIAESAREEATEQELAQAKWEASYLQDRALMSSYVTRETQARLDAIDFSALAREQYTLDPEKFQIPERRRASHILIGLDDRSDEDALARANEVILKLNAGGDFGELAAEYSDDPSVASNGGDLGLFGQGAMVAPFAEATWALEVGETSEPVRTNFGYHIIRLMATEPPRIQAFEEVESRLVSELRRQRQPGVRQEFIEEMKAASIKDGIVQNQEAIKALEARYLEAGTVKP